VTGGGVPNGEMPNILRPGRRDVSPLSEAALAALLAGTEPPAEPAPGLQHVADVLAALRAGPTSAELAGEARALAEFRRRTGVPALPRRSRHREPWASASRLGVKVAAVAGITALSLGGLATAAVNGALPAPVQRFAHEAVGAPPASGGSPVTTQGHRAKHRTSASSQGTGQVVRPAAPGPCTAYVRASVHGSRAQRAAAFRDLIKAAGGAGGVTAYCGRAMPRPGWPGPWPPYPTRRQGPPGQHNTTLPRGRNGGGIPPGERRGHHGPHANDKPSARQAGRRFQHPPRTQGQRLKSTAVVFAPLITTARVSPGTGW
jgi:hypothetical protein